MTACQGSIRTPFQSPRLQGSGLCICGHSKALNHGHTQPQITTREHILHAQSDHAKHVHRPGANAFDCQERVSHLFPIAKHQFLERLFIQSRELHQRQHTMGLCRTQTACPDGFPWLLTQRHCIDCSSAELFQPLADALSGFDAKLLPGYDSNHRVERASTLKRGKGWMGRNQSMELNICFGEVGTKLLVLAFNHGVKLNIFATWT